MDARTSSRVSSVWNGERPGAVSFSRLAIKISTNEAVIGSSFAALLISLCIRGGWKELEVRWVLTDNETACNVRDGLVGCLILGAIVSDVVIITFTVGIT